MSPRQRTYTVDFESYLLGSIPEVEAALCWCKSFVGDAFPNHPSEIDDNFVCFELENTLREIALDEIREEVLAVFKDCIDCKITDPKEIWGKLTVFPINYGNAIGMESYTNYKWHETSHRKFGKWHEINFSPTGHWLIEFQSMVNLDITFHIPYNHFPALNIEVEVKIPRKNSAQSNFGREINTGEQKRYPLEKLLQILGSSSDDFPYELQKYSKTSLNSMNDYLDENYDDEDFEY